MFHFKIIKYFYLFLTIFCLITPQKIDILHLFPGIILLWLSYFVFTFNLNTFKIKRNSTLDTNYRFLYKKVILVTYPLFYTLYIKFYTGQTLQGIFLSLNNATSNYSNYQEFFQEQALNEFTLNKLPYIIGNGVLKYFYFSFIFHFFINFNKRSKFDYFLVLYLTIIYLAVSISRGTSFEFFEIFILFFTSYAIYRKTRGSKVIIKPIKLFYVILIGVVFVMYFSYNIQMRFGDNFINFLGPDFNDTSLINIISPSLAIALYLLHGYFLFGINYMSIIFLKFSNTTFGYISIFIPKGISVFKISQNYRTYVQQYIDLGVKWNPDIAFYIDNLGIFFTFTFIFIIGSISRSFFKSSSCSLNSSILVYFSILFMISLHIGDFITASSSNMICLLIALFFSKYKKLSPFRWIN